MSCILLISPEPWETLAVSKHHYARELVRRGHRVLFYGPPAGAGPLQLDAVAAEGTGRLEVLRSPPVALGLRLMPSTLRRVLEARWLARVENLAGGRIDVVWLFENSRFFNMHFAGERLKIYHQVDLDQNFKPEEAAATADISLAISTPIESRISGSARRILRITHGCPPRSTCDSEPSQLDAAFSRKRVNAVMTGNMSRAYLDLDVLADLIDKHPDVGFHFVGRHDRGLGLHARVSEASNVVFWGQYPASALPAFLDRADVLLAIYKAEHCAQMANPHKMMEYFAAGRCVLASRTLEYENRPDLVETARSRDDLKARFAAIVADPPAFNTPDLIARRRAFAADNTYPRQLDRIAAALGPSGRLIS